MNTTNHQQDARPAARELLFGAALNIAQAAIAWFAFNGATWAQTIVYAMLIIGVILAPLILIGRAVMEAKGEVGESHWKKPVWYKAISIIADLATIAYVASIGSVLMVIFAVIGMFATWALWQKPKTTEGSAP